VEVINFASSVKEGLRKDLLEFADGNYEKVENEIKRKQHEKVENEIKRKQHEKVENEIKKKQHEKVENEIKRKQQLNEETLVQKKVPPPSSSSSSSCSSSSSSSSSFLFNVITVVPFLTTLFFLCWLFFRKHPILKVSLIIVFFALCLVFPDIFLDQVLYPVCLFIKNKYIFFITETGVGRTVRGHLQLISQSSFVQTRFLPLFNIFVKIILQVKSFFVFVFGSFIENNRKRRKRLKKKRDDEIFQTNKNEHFTDRYNQVFN
jgi:hypothetical protein